MVRRKEVVDMAIGQQSMRHPRVIGGAVVRGLTPHRLGSRVTVIALALGVIVGITAGYVAARTTGRASGIERTAEIVSQPGIQSYTWPQTQPYGSHPGLTRGQAASADRWAAQAAAYLAVQKAAEQDRQRALEASTDRWAGQASQWLALQAAQEEARERALEASADRWAGLATEWLALQEAQRNNAGDR
jgi:hypothetical protein